MSEYKQTVRTCDYCDNQSTFRNDVIGETPFTGWTRLHRTVSQGCGSRVVHLDFCSDKCLLNFAAQPAKNR